MRAQSGLGAAETASFCRPGLPGAVATLVGPRGIPQVGLLWLLMWALPPSAPPQVQGNSGLPQGKKRNMLNILTSDF